MKTASLLENQRNIGLQQRISVPPHLCALVRLLTCVYAAVLSQVTGNAEGLSAVDAGVGPLSSVRPHVLLQVSARRPALPTNRAHIWTFTCVAPHVHVECGQCGESFGAVGAAVRSLATMCAKVPLQAIARLEAFTAL